MNEYRVKITVKNNLLLSAMEAAGYIGWGSVSRFAEDAGVSATQVSMLITMKMAPIGEEGEFTAAAKAVMEVLGAAPSDLWTDVQLNTRLHRNSAETTVDGRALAVMLEQHQEAMTLPSPEEGAERTLERKLVAGLLERVPPRQAKVLALRFGIGCNEHRLDQIADILGVTVERVRQIESVSLRKIRRSIAESVAILPPSQE
jgi:DNA-directed RNA polymerase sigma subunit (sigma70/sigma32)